MGASVLGVDGVPLASHALWTLGPVAVLVDGRTWEKVFDGKYSGMHFDGTY